MGLHKVTRNQANSLFLSKIKVVAGVTIMKIIDINTLVRIIQSVGLDEFFLKLIHNLEEDFARWEDFYKSPRHATHYPQGVIELMPISDKDLYSFKYVNGHPINTRDNKLCVVAIGMLSDARNGYPLMISEMTLLTAFRTAATGALGAKYLARKESKNLAIIGTGAQAEFQIRAFNTLFPIEAVTFYDIDAEAMNKFSHNLAMQNFQLLPCSTIRQCVKNADIIVTATAAKKRVNLFSLDDLKPGAHIHAMGGDCPGKTEFDAQTLKHSKVVVEYLEQSLLEGEIQQGDQSMVYSELWEIVKGNKPARENAQEFTFFDSVGFALEDYSILRLVYQLANEQSVGTAADLIPQLDDPKNLFGLLN